MRSSNGFDIGEVSFVGCDLVASFSRLQGAGVFHFDVLGFSLQLMFGDAREVVLFGTRGEELSLISLSDILLLFGYFIVVYLGHEVIDESIAVFEVMEVCV